MDALKAFKKGDCLVTVPTGAGKTWIAEQAIARTVEGGGKAWYASPLKALNNSKFSEFSRLLVRKTWASSPATARKTWMRPSLSAPRRFSAIVSMDAMHWGEDSDTDFVILDEAHFLGDEERGVVWEETMIYLPRRIPLLLLSATIGNAHQIAGWLKSIRNNDCTVIEETAGRCRSFPCFSILRAPCSRFWPAAIHPPLKNDCTKKSRNSPISNIPPA
ncbi:MAG: DEAD/DEAH box helicase [Desulfobacterales bacterium]